MAKAVAIVEKQDGAPSKGPSLVVQIAVLLVLSLAAAGAGYFSGGMLKGETAADPAAAAPAAGHGAKPEGEHGKAGEVDDPAAADLARGVLNLPAITTNLAAPSDTWMRVELAAVFEGEVDVTIADTVHQDILAYLRTVKLHQVEGASGFLHLKDDIRERARIRGEGKVKDILIRTIVFE
jgi:flagellar FliL protein